MRNGDLDAGQLLTQH